MRFAIEQIWIDEDAVEEPLTGEIVRRLPGVRVLVGEECVEARRLLDLQPDPVSLGKRILRLMRNRGAFVKPCPGTPKYVCCGLQILHIGQGCPMDCRYCALQVYFNRPVLEVFVNVKDLLRDLQRCLRAQPWRFRRFCTGEFTDSLALDPLTGLSARLVEFFSRVDNACLEIKTKTDLVDPLLGLDPRGRVIVSFSVNSAGNSRGEERRAASLSSRLAAAAKIQEGGYLLGFHFDPIIPVPGWQDGYSQTVDAIFRSADPSRIAWISLGVLRFVPELKQVATARHGPIPYFHNGFVRGLDGKSRLPVARRIEIYRLLAKRIARHWPDARIYLCMESPYVWQKSLGVPIRSDDDLIKYLDDAVTGDTSALSSK